MQQQQSHQLDLAAAGIALFVGIGALFFPKLLLRVYGVDPADLTGPGLFGWRLFAIRNLLIGGAAMGGNRQAQNSILYLQAPDLALFAHAYRTRSVPRLTSVGAILTASLVATLGILARTKS